MRRTSLVVAVLVAALALSATAAAEINSFAEARRGSLHVLSSVLVSGHSVDMRGGWFNTSLSCTTSRRLRVRAEIQRTTTHSSAITGTAKTGGVVNCAEGAPTSDSRSRHPTPTWRARTAPGSRVATTS